MKHLLILLILTLGTQYTVFGSTVVVRKYDANKDGRISASDELRYFLSDLSGILSSEIDSDSSGIVGLKELEAAQKQVERDIAEGVRRLERKYGASRTSYTIEEVRSTFTPLVADPGPPEPEPETNTYNKMQFFVRQKHDDIGFLDVPDKKISGATLGFSRDFEAGNGDRWDIDIAVIGKKKLTREGSSDGLAFLPSISLDYSDENRNSSEGEADSLVGRLGLQHIDSEADFSGIYTASLFAATDTNFRSNQGGLELMWQPLIPGTFVGYVHDVGETPLRIHFRPGLRTELGYVFDSGRKEALLPIEDTGFVRLGPKGDLDLWLDTDLPILDRLTATVSVIHLEALTSRADSGTFFESALNYRFDDTGDFALKLEYERGEIPLSQDLVDKITLGLGFKF